MVLTLISSSDPIAIGSSAAVKLLLADLVVLEVGTTPTRKEVRRVEVMTSRKHVPDVNSSKSR
jgi:hypothetical protein